MWSRYMAVAFPSSAGLINYGVLSLRVNMVCIRIGRTLWLWRKALSISRGKKPQSGLYKLVVETTEIILELVSGKTVVW